MNFHKSLYNSFLVILLLVILSACEKDDNVKNTKIAPLCRITSPTNGEDIPWGENVIINVNAEDVDGSIRIVYFRLNGKIVDSSKVEPYYTEWNTTEANTGVYTLGAISIDNRGLRKKAENVLIELTPDGVKPVAKFSADTLIGESPFTVTFTDLSTNNPTSWKWDFGDGTTSTKQNPTHTFRGNWSYTVSLRAINPNGWHEEVKTEYIKVGGYGQPCPGTPSVAWQGRTYKTVLIGTQCWMKRNLNYETGNSWCYDNDPENCDTYGRLYDWTTIMNGSSSSNTNPSGVQGICPDGWHIPSDREWRVLEGITDSKYSYGYAGWNIFDWRGSDAGKRLKSSSGWYDNGHGTDSFGFAAVPGAYRNYSGFYYYYREGAYFWTSTQNGTDNGIYRRLYYSRDQIERNFKHKEYGMSVRCVMD